MLTRVGIVRLLGEAGIEVAGEAEDARGLLRLVAAEHPDAAVVDIRMPPTHSDEGLVAAHQIRVGHPGVGVLVLSQYVEPGYAMRLIGDRPEGVGYLLKERVFDAAILVDALAGSATANASSTRQSSPGSPAADAKRIRSLT